jgi:ABC-type transport system involved in multi-copper enzyme maturation permease subunit
MSEFARVEGIANVARAELFAWVRRPAIWTIFAAIAVLNQVFSYVVPYLSYRTSDTSGFNAGETPAELLASTLPGQIVPNTLGGFPVFAGALALAFGALAFGSDHGWDTVKTLLTQRPSRSVVVAGKVAAMAIWIVGAVVVLFALSSVTSVAIAVGEGKSSAFPGIGHLVAGVASGALVLMMWSSVGATLSVILRGVALPIGLGIVWALGVESLLSAMADSMLSALDPLRSLLPGVNAGSLVAAVSPERIGEAAPGVSATVGEARSLLTLAAYVVGCALVAMWTTRRRDVS